MAVASPKAKPQSPAPAELVSHQEWLDQHADRVATINREHAQKLVELEAATARATAAHTKATTQAQAAHHAERLQRHEAVVSDIVEFFKGQIYAGTPRTFDKVEILGKHFRNRDAEKLRLTGQPLTNELAVAMCEAFAEKHPGALARFANRENWIPFFGFGLASATQGASAAFRNFEFDLKAQLEAVLNLESTIARIGTTPHYQCVAADEAPALWEIIRACWPGDVDEEKRLAHAAEVKRRAVAQSIEEQGLRVNAVLGDDTAREKLRARGAGVLEDVLKSARTILALAGFRAEQLNELPLTAAGGIK